MEGFADDRVLVAIILAGQVVPYLSTPGLVLLAVDDAARRWQERASTGSPMDIGEFVDRYCMGVEAAAGGDDEECLSRVWFAHVMRLAWPGRLVAAGDRRYGREMESGG
jgi:hypothetical protein